VLWKFLDPVTPLLQPDQPAWVPDQGRS